VALPSIRPIAGLVAATVAAATLLAGDPAAFALNGPRWPQPQTPYVVNAANLDLAGDAADAAVRAGAAVWQQQSAAFQFAYAGSSTLAVAGNDAINLVVFRNASSGSAIATTYWWSSGSRIIDADIVFWDAAFRFFAGSSGCDRGFYIEDIAAHEFGHALGLGHSTSAPATMYPSAGSCDSGLRQLDGDDIAGVRALYPLTQPPPTPTGLRFVGVGL
jgi:hypothetical protein